MRRRPDWMIAVMNGLNGQESVPPLLVVFELDVFDYEFGFAFNLFLSDNPV